MVTAARPASVALLTLFAFGFADAIRTLRDGPMIDAEGREYKTAALGFDRESQISEPQFNEGSTISVQCTEVSIIIAVKADFFKNGRLLSPRDFLLGEVKHSQSSQCRPVAAGDSEYVFEAGLQDCGSKVTTSKDSVIYSNKLIILLAAGQHGIKRTTHAVIPVSCHYKRTKFDGSHSQQPPLSLPAVYSTGAFSLKLMTEDWTGETLTSVFYTGDLLYLEASYSSPDAGRLFIDGCVAALSPDPRSAPRYYFIQNHGCFNDAKEEGSNALFNPRTRSSSLQLQLDAFLFPQDTRNSIFITCQLKATSEMRKSSPVNKACNYINSRWINVDGSDDVCRCCDDTCSSYSPTGQTNLGSLIPEDLVARETVTLGPLMVLPYK
ncbi:zona pellucida sperm-binding protein 3-like [Trematomus bernacchii]|uniref:zona pellucida sperm-binding protein 3-like n=1 Tax=Trematomus bernacchii TaxID=40690 RepID=UPI00146E5783|nr:zona pellucida sperm-binding protein 3-like [Trematomus bernacchii]